MAEVVCKEGGRFASYDFGVWVDGKPAGRIRIRDGKHHAYTNKVAPGAVGSHLGAFEDRDAAAEAVAARHLEGAR